LSYAEIVRARERAAKDMVLAGRSSLTEGGIVQAVHDRKARASGGLVEVAQARGHTIRHGRSIG
jgi:hypothetical protein